MRLAKEDPEALERLRQEAIEDLISNAPEQHQRRLRGLQFQVDMERQRAKNPMDSCIKISRLMHDSFSKLRDTLNEAQQTHVAQLKSILNQKAKRSQPEQASNEAVETKKVANANIVQFPGRS
ncbi:MAG TPA: DUF3135 domain-containing protein [Gammaproteobacteria bacterium]|nr:hypothetical protein [Gammaproteobacteria bacterium]HBF07931.1 DUF3135 domain-containing protein [Gammaproteobacteria bacterium]HCK92932.1 DUF3135 domain-containing protein [Gammaproteobacteria bacterium]